MGYLQVAEPVNVMFFNSLQVAQSERYLFAEHDNFELALQMLRDNPRFKEGPWRHRGD
jgi:hypothetical protein